MSYTQLIDTANAVSGSGPDSSAPASEMDPCLPSHIISHHVIWLFCVRDQLINGLSRLRMYVFSNSRSVCPACVCDRLTKHQQTHERQNSRRFFFVVRNDYYLVCQFFARTRGRSTTEYQPSKRDEYKRRISSGKRHTNLNDSRPTAHGWNQCIAYVSVYI